MCVTTIMARGNDATQDRYLLPVPASGQPMTTTTAAATYQSPNAAWRNTRVKGVDVTHLSRLSVSLVRRADVVSPRLHFILSAVDVNRDDAYKI